jgi:ribosomal protein S27AE
MWTWRRRAVPETNKMKCPDCDAEMNHHADKLDYGAAADDAPDATEGDAVIEAHTCPACGRTAARPAAQ